MPEFTPQQLDQYRTNLAIAAVLDRQMKFDRPLLIVKPKPRKTRSDKMVATVLTEQSSAPNVAA